MNVDKLVIKKEAIKYSDQYGNMLQNKEIVLDNSDFLDGLENSISNASESHKNADDLESMDFQNLGTLIQLKKPVIKV